MKRHLLEKGGHAVACGRQRFTVATEDPDRVDCILCLRTEAFRVAWAEEVRARAAPMAAAGRRATAPTRRRANGRLGPCG